jgi:hypothetical protein
MAIARDNTPERLVSASRAEEEQGFELKLRPRWLREFIGQSKAKEQLAIALEAAKSRGEALDHVLLFGRGKPRWPPSSPTNWTWDSSRPPALRFRFRAT